MLRTPTPRRHLSAETIIREVTEDEEYGDYLANHHPSTAFRSTAMALIELGTGDTGYRNKTCDQLHVVATLGDFVSANVALRHNELSRKEAYALKRDGCTPFMGALEALVDHDPGASYAEVVSFLRHAYNGMPKSDNAPSSSEAREILANAAAGVMHQIFMEQLADYLGYDVLEASAEDDLKGADRFIVINGKREAIDAKASPETAHKAREKDRYGRLIVWTHIRTDDTGGTFRLTPDQVAKYAPSFQAELDQEWSRVSSLRAATSHARR